VGDVPLKGLKQRMQEESGLKHTADKNEGGTREKIKNASLAE
jgi:hypothetical protein